MQKFEMVAEKYQNRKTNKYLFLVLKIEQMYDIIMLKEVRYDTE